MNMKISRRRSIEIIGFACIFPAASHSQQAEVWSAERAFEAIKNDELLLIDVRSRGEWNETGVAEGAWPISIHEPNFPQRLFKAKELAGDRQVGLICSAGGRSGSVMRAVRKAGYEGFVDVSEGMMGSKLGRGWIAKGLPLNSATEALSLLPNALR